MFVRAILVALIISMAFLFIGCPSDDDKEETPQKSLAITSPNGGESWTVSSTHTVTWTSNGVSTVTIELSTDGGTTYTALVSGISNADSWNWTLPTNVAAACRIKVRDASDANVFDVSDANFAIAVASATDNASGSVNSDTSGVITTPEGAMITIPIDAVPRRLDGTASTMVFSIESTTDIQIIPPTGDTVITRVYRFGPEGFIFAAPVEIAIPVLTAGDPGNVAIYRINPTTNQPEYYGAAYDSATRTIRAQTYELCLGYGTSSPQRNTAWGCLYVNNESGKWLSICVEQYNLSFPDIDSIVVPELGVGSLWAPFGEIGWASEGNWYLPQGSYRMCLQYRMQRDPWVYAHQFRDVIINEAYNRTWNPHCQLFTVGTPVTPDTGRCDCVPTPSGAVGTGDIQVTLTWHLAAPGVDLDLWVMDPDSDWCFYGNGAAPDCTASGGQLDLDNACGNYRDGRPENIYWTRPPLVGEYIVAVDWFSTCGSSVPSLQYNVRTVVQGNTRTFTGTITEYQDMLEVARFQVTGAFVEFLPRRDDPIVLNFPKPRKE
jgi:hypothetical protein